MANNILSGLFGRRSQDSQQNTDINKKKELTELEKIDLLISDMEAAQNEQYQQGKKPWEFDLSSITTTFKKNREEKEAEELRLMEANAVVPNIKQSEQLPIPKSMEAKVETSYQTPLQKEQGISGQKFDINVKTIPDIYKSVGPSQVYDKQNNITRIYYNENRTDKRGNPIKILKEDDWIKSQPWAMQDEETGTWYTTKLDLPKGVYKRDWRAVPGQITEESTTTTPLSIAPSSEFGLPDTTISYIKNLSQANLPTSLGTSI